MNHLLCEVQEVSTKSSNNAISLQSLMWLKTIIYNHEHQVLTLNAKFILILWVDESVGHINKGSNKMITDELPWLK